MSKWIPITEKEPEIGEDVLICTLDKWIAIFHRTGERWEDQTCGYRRTLEKMREEGINIVAWRPLPKPYKGK